MGLVKSAKLIGRRKIVALNIRIDIYIHIESVYAYNAYLYMYV